MLSAERLAGGDTSRIGGKPPQRAATVEAVQRDQFRLLRQVRNSRDRVTGSFTEPVSLPRSLDCRDTEVDDVFVTREVNPKRG